MIAESLLLILSTTMRPLPEFKPAPREFRAAWVATVDNIDWPSRKDLSTSQQKAELKRIIEVAAASHLNALILQVRTSCDSLYESELEPWSEFLTGAQGTAPQPKWDPLAFAVEESHKRGIELHAWLNPYRAKHFKATGQLAQNHLVKSRPDIAKQYGRYYWLDPGAEDTRTKTLAVVADIVKRYDIDGIHIDDYFYPYAEKDASGNTIPFPDSDSFQAFRASGGTLSKSDWRRQNVDVFVENFYKSVKQLKPWVKVGISPFGIYRPNQPEGIKAGIDQYDDPLYADCLKWLQEGWCDYFTPQLYWTMDSPGQPYGKLLAWWSAQNTKERALWPGNYTGKIASDNGNWSFKEVARQIEATREAHNAQGNVHFSFKAFLQNQKNIRGELTQGLYQKLAIAPAMPWLGSEQPATPEVEFVKCDSDSHLAWSSPLAGWSCLYRLSGDRWKLVSSRFSEPNHQETFPLDHGMATYAVTVVSRTGIESEPGIITVSVD